MQKIVLGLLALVVVALLGFAFWYVGESTPEQRRCVEDELNRLIASAPKVI